MKLFMRTTPRKTLVRSHAGCSWLWRVSVIREELSIAYPLSSLVELLCRPIALGNIQAHSTRPERPRVVFDCLDQRRANPTASSSVGNEQIVEDEDPRERRGGKAGIQLGKADRPIANGSDEHGGLAMVEPVLQEGMAGREVGLLALKLAVLIKEIGQNLKVRKHCLANGDGGHAGGSCRGWRRA